MWTADKNSAAMDSNLILINNLSLNFPYEVLVTIVSLASFVGLLLVDSITSKLAIFEVG